MDTLAAFAVGIAEATSYQPVPSVIGSAGGPFQDRGLEHDPEKWQPVFRKDHAPVKSYSAIPIPFKSHRAVVYQNCVRMNPPLLS
jgi:hypothetical protein